MHQGRRQVRIDTDRLTDMADVADTPTALAPRGDNLAGSEQLTGQLMALLHDDRAMVTNHVRGQLRRARWSVGLSLSAAVTVGLLAALWGVGKAEDMAEAQAEAATVRAALAASESKAEALAIQMETMAGQVHAIAEREALAADRLGDMTDRLEAARLQLLDEQRARLEAEAAARLLTLTTDPPIPYRNTNAVNNWSVVDGMRGWR
jgi:hypothetical protein